LNDQDFGLGGGEFIAQGSVKYQRGGSPALLSVQPKRKRGRPCKKRGGAQPDILIPGKYSKPGPGGDFSLGIIPWYKSPGRPRKAKSKNNRRPWRRGGPVSSCSDE